MFFMKIDNNLSWSILSLLPLLLRPTNQLQRRQKTHDYSQLIWGSDYIFESIKTDIEGCMTAFGKGIKPGDYILLQQNHKSCRYQVEEIDYYSDPSDMWIALLKQVVIE